jgi:hypothetical protein
MRITRTVLLFLLAAIPSALAQSTPAPADQHPNIEVREKTPEPVVSTYQLDYHIHELEGGKRVNTRSYIMRITDSNGNNRASLKTGSRVPITTSSVVGSGNSGSSATIQYQDIGVNIEVRLARKESPSETPILVTSVDISGIAAEPSGPSTNPVIRSNRAESSTAVLLGKPMLLVNIDDALSKRSYQVEVTVTRQ